MQAGVAQWLRNKYSLLLSMYFSLLFTGSYPTGEANMQASRDINSLSVDQFEATCCSEINNYSFQPSCCDFANSMADSEPGGTASLTVLPASLLDNL